MVKERLNVSTSGYRVLRILLLLVRYRSLSLNELNLHLLDDPHILRTYNSETITKYVNTLRQVGCFIPPANRAERFRYSLQASPFAFSFQSGQWQSILNFSEQLAKIRSPLLQPWLKLLNRLCFHLKSEQAQALQAFYQEFVDTSDQSDSTLSPSALSSYKTLCQEGHLLQFVISNGAPPRWVELEPHDAFVEQGQVWLSGRCRKTSRIIRTAVQHIQQLKQLPQKAKHPREGHTVVFELHGRLAANYRPYADETMTRSADGQVVMVKTTTHNLHELQKRLMKYGGSCVILVPNALRTMVRDQVKQQLAVLVSTS